MPIETDVMRRVLLYGEYRTAVVAALIAAALLTYISYRKTNPTLPSFKRWVATLLRFSAFTLLFIFLLEPVIAKVHKRLVPPKLIVLVDNSTSLTIQNRRQIVKQVMDSDGISELEKKYKTETVLFADSITNSPELNFSGEKTAIGDALSSIASRARKDNIQTVVLLSDGNNNSGDDPTRAAARAPFRVFSIGIGNTASPLDIAVSSVVAPNIAYKNNPTEIVAFVEGWGTTKDVVVYLQKDGKILDQKRVSPGGKGEQVEVHFTISPNDTGDIFYTVKTASVRGEITTKNNSRSVAMRVLPSKQRIMLLFDRASWDLPFIKRAIASNPNYELSLCDVSARIQADVVPFPVTDAELNKFQMIAIIGSPNGIPSSVLRRLKSYAEAGGSILLVLNRKAGTPNDLWDVLPVESGDGRVVSDEFVPVFTIDGNSHPITAIGDDRQKVVQGLPPLSGFVMLGKLQENSKTLLMHPTVSNIPILAIRKLSSSKSAILQGSGFWKWGFLPFGFGQDDTPFRKLILNLTQWLLAKEQEKPLALRSLEKVYRSGESIQLSAILTDPAHNPVAGAMVKVKLIHSYMDSLGRKNNDTTEAVMEELGDGLYRFDFASLPPGDYSAYASGTDAKGNRIGRDKTRFRVEPYSLELTSLKQNKALLKAVAELSGGSYLTPNETNKLPDMIKMKSIPRSTRNEKPLWGNPYLLVIFILLLSAEWLFRKRWNLP